MQLRNRFVRSATADMMAERTGHVSTDQLREYSELADGGVGFIITGITFIHPNGRGHFFQNSMATNDDIPGWRTLTDMVHAKGAKIACQLFHPGKRGSAISQFRQKEA